MPECLVDPDGSLQECPDVLVGAVFRQPLDPFRGICLQTREPQLQQAVPGEALVPAIRHPARNRAALPDLGSLIEERFAICVRDFLKGTSENEVVRGYRHRDGIKQAI